MVLVLANFWRLFGLAFLELGSSFGSEFCPFLNWLIVFFRILGLLAFLHLFVAFSLDFIFFCFNFCKKKRVKEVLLD